MAFAEGPWLWVTKGNKFIKPKCLCCIEVTLKDCDSLVASQGSCGKENGHWLQVKKGARGSLLLITMRKAIAMTALAREIGANPRQVNCRVTG